MTCGASCAVLLLLPCPAAAVHDGSEEEVAVVRVDWGCALLPAVVRSAEEEVEGGSCTQVHQVALEAVAAGSCSRLARGALPGRF